MSFDEEADHYMSKSDFAQMCGHIKQLEAEIARLNHQHKNDEAANNMLSDTCARQKDEIGALKMRLMSHAGKI